MDALIEGLRLVTAWPAVGLMLVGVLIGLYLGAIPGLGGLIGFSLLLPFTFGMEPVAAFALLLGMFAVTTTSDTLSAVLLGVPGPAGAATLMDGHPLAKRGEAMRALGAAYTSSAIGGVLGAMVGAASLPILKPIVLTFGPPEFFMLGVLGLTFVGALSGGSMVKGAAAALFGLLLSTIGYSTQGGIARYSFEINYLLNGFEIVPVVLGLFAIPELIDLAIKGLPIARVDDGTKPQKGQMLQGMREALQHWWLLVRASVIGIYIGFLPGIGGSVADWAGYGHAVQSAKDKSQFGKGDIRGVIAPEAANNSVKGGDLLPTVAFGIPGSPSMSILLGAFVIHGLRPGPEMLTTKLPVTFSMMWTIAIANVVGAAILMVWSRQIAKITFVRGHLLVPGIMVFAFMGAWMTSNQLGDWITLICFGALGHVMRRAGWPRPPVVLGFVLGPIMETNLDLSRQAFGWDFLGRTWVLVMLAILVLALAMPLWRALRGLRTQAAADAGTAAKPVGAPAGHPVMSAGLAAALVALFAGAYLLARPWSTDASFFPIVTSVFGLALAALATGTDLLRWRVGQGGAQQDGDALGVLTMFGMLIGMVALSLLLGQYVALPLTVALFLLLWARERWIVVAAQAVAAVLILEFIFDRLLHPIWLVPVVQIF
jgi:putative tricarboxylic transport membrane protein